MGFNLIYVFRAIYFGLGCADDPDVDDYYSRARGYPITYSPDDDPEVIEEMRIANAELKRGGVDADEDDGEGEIQDSLSEDSSGDEDGEIDEDGWDDDDDEMVSSGANQSERHKRKPKVLSCVDKVCENATSVKLLLTNAQFSFMQSLLIFFALKSNARRSEFLFGMSVRQSIATLFPSAA